jgi:hypothetical protein
MPDSICLTGCLYQDEQGRIGVRTDNETVACASDGNGGTHLVATSNYANLPPWPYACDATAHGQPIYRAADGKLYAGLKPYYKTGEAQSFSLLPDLPQQIGINNNILREASTLFRNEDPCGRSVQVDVQFYFNGYEFKVSNGTSLYLRPEVTVDGSYWEPIQGTGLGNATGSAGYIFTAESALSWTRRTIVPAGGQAVLGMRWRTSEDPVLHTPGQNFQAGAGSLFGFQLIYEAKSID